MFPNLSIKVRAYIKRHFSLCVCIRAPFYRYRFIVVGITLKLLPSLAFPYFFWFFAFRFVHRFSSHTCYPPVKCMVLCGVLFFKCYFFSSSSMCHCIVFGILILTWVNMALHFQAPPNEREARELKKMANKFLSNVNLYRYWYMFEMPHHIVRIKWNSFYCYCFMFCMLMILNILSVSLSLVSFLVNLLFDLRLMSLLASFYFDEKSHAALNISICCAYKPVWNHTPKIYSNLRCLWILRFRWLRHCSPFTFFNRQIYF